MISFITYYAYFFGKWWDDQPPAVLNSLESLPLELQGEIAAFTQTKGLYSLCCTSKSMRERLFTIIARNDLLLSRICSFVVKLNQLDNILSDLKIHSAPNQPHKLTLSLYSDQLHQAEKVVALFGRLQMLCVVGRSDLQIQQALDQKKLNIPPCRELILKRLRICNVSTKQLCKSVKIIDCGYLTIRDFRNIHAEYVSYNRFWGIAGFCISPNYELQMVENEPTAIGYWLQATRNPIISNKQRRILLEKSLECLPQFIPARLELARRETNSAKSIQICKEIIAERPEIAEAHRLLEGLLFLLSQDDQANELEHQMRRLTLC